MGTGGRQVYGYPTAEGALRGWCKIVDLDGTRIRAKATVERYLAGLELPYRAVGEHEWAVAVGGNAGLLLSVSLAVRDYTLSLFCFFMRAPEQNVEQIYRLLLRKQLEMFAVKFCLEDDGDLYLKAETPLTGLNEEHLDRLLGSFQHYAEQTYPAVLRLGWAEPVG